MLPFYVFLLPKKNKKKKKKQRKHKQTDQRGNFVEKQLCVKTRSNRQANLFASSFLSLKFSSSFSLTPIISLSLSLKLGFIPLFHYIDWSLSLSYLLSPIVVLTRPIGHHNENPISHPDGKPKKIYPFSSFFFFFFFFAFGLWVRYDLIVVVCGLQLLWIVSMVVVVLVGGIHGSEISQWRWVWWVLISDYSVHHLHWRSGELVSKRFLDVGNWKSWTIFTNVVFLLFGFEKKILIWTMF